MDGSESIATALIRAWLETDDTVVLKVRITSATETGELATIGTAATVDAACEIIRTWLQRFVDCSTDDRSERPPDLSSGC